MAYDCRTMWLRDHPTHLTVAGQRRTLTGFAFKPWHPGLRGTMTEPEYSVGWSHLWFLLRVYHRPPDLSNSVLGGLHAHAGESGGLTFALVLITIAFQTPGGDLFRQ
jgi:hypothetical protein